MTPQQINRLIERFDAARAANAILLSINADLAAACQAAKDDLEEVPGRYEMPSVSLLRAALARQRTETPAEQKGTKL